MIPSQGPGTTSRYSAHRLSIFASWDAIGIAGLVWFGLAFLVAFCTSRDATLWLNNVLDLQPLRWPSASYTYDYFKQLGPHGRWYHFLANCVDLFHSASYFVFGGLLANRLFNVNRGMITSYGFMWSVWSIGIAFILDEIENVLLMFMLLTYTFISWPALAVVQSIITSVKHVALISFFCSLLYALYDMATRIKSAATLARTGVKEAFDPARFKHTASSS